MARRRGGDRSSTSLIWPGFVDAMTALLLVLMFVLSIFMIVQFVLREELSGKDDALENLSAQLGALTSQLSLAEQESEFYQAELQSLTGLLEDERERAQELTAALDEETAESDRLSAELQEKVIEVSALASTLAETEGRADELTTLVAVLTDERDAAQFAVADLQRRNEETAAIEQENVTLRQQIIDLTAQREAVTADLATARQEAADALAAAERAAQEALAAAQAQSNDALEAVRQAAAEELDQVRAEAARQLGAVQTELEAAREQLRIVRTELQTAQSTIAERDAAAVDLDAARAAAAQELAATQVELQSARDQLITLQNAVQAAQLRAQTAEATIADRDASATERDALLATVRRQLEEAANRSRETELTLGEKIAALELALDKKREEAEQTLVLLAAAEAKRDELQDETAALEERAASQIETMSRRDLAAALARTELQSERAVSEQGRRAVALLNAQVRQLRNEIAGLRLQLDESEARDAENQVVIQDLGTRLNQALAAKVGELQRYRSEFFGRMREALGDRDDIRIVGDRFVFQSEVLFRTGEAQLGAEGRLQLSRLAAAIRDIQGAIPEDVNWMLRIDGHTDRVPISGAGRYRNNWELSQARALSVVEFMINQEGLSPNRLAAAGFGEYQPIDPGDTPDALARNRRIEMRLTER